MTGGDGIETQQIGAFAESIELQMPITFDARVGCQTLTVGLHIWIDHVGVELVGEVEHEMVDVELLCDAARIVDIGDRTAAGVALASPQAHRDAYDVMTGVEQFGSGHR
jgi:hypothetical protein